MDPREGHGGAHTSEFPVEGGSEMDIDPQLAAAIEASYRSQTTSGLQQSEEEMIAQAIEMSKREEEARRSGVPLPDPATSGSGGSADSGMPLPSIDTVAHDRMVAEAMQLDSDPRTPAVPFVDSSRPSTSGTDPGARGLLPVPDPEGESDRDRELAMAIEASYAMQTEAGQMANEDDMLAQAMRMSRLEEESRQRSALRDQQEQELQESILMDQVREQEVKRKQQEEEQLQPLEDSRRRKEEEDKAAHQERQMAELAAKRSRLPPEPPQGEPGRVDVQVRMRDGRRLRRAFRASDSVGSVYDYVDVEGGEACAAQAYVLVSTMPRCAYGDRSQTLETAGLSGQCALLVEAVQS